MVTEYKYLVSNSECIKLHIFFAVSGEMYTSTVGVLREIISLRIHNDRRLN